MTLNSVSSMRQVGADYLFLDSGAQLHACPLTYPGHKIPLPDPGIHTASGARVQHDGGRLVTYKLPEGRTIRVLFHACAVQRPILSLGRVAQQGYWSDLLQTLEHCCFLTRPRRNVATQSCTRKRVCSLSKGRWYQSPMPIESERLCVEPAPEAQLDSSKVLLSIHSTQKINDMNNSHVISDLSTHVKKRAQRSDDSILLRHMDDVVGTGPEEHLVSDFEHMKTVCI